MTPQTFSFKGTVPSSKSILNRLLVIQSYHRDLVIGGDSDADDVIKMKAALRALENGEVADCGAAGTTLRFLALKASRIPGRHILKGTRRLFSRPQGELISILEQLGCRAEFSDESVAIEGNGWRIPEEGLRVPREVSSQFASAVVLNSWHLDKPLTLIFSGERVSESYFAMTLELVHRLGLEWRSEGYALHIPSRAQVRSTAIECEIDVSSAFAVAALAAVTCGRAEIECWPGESSLQPDAIFPRILSEMGCEVSVADRVLSVTRRRGQSLRPIRWNLRESPDLFPVLGTLCAFAEGRSVLFGAPHLAHKESSRIVKTAELIRLIGALAHEKDDGMDIEGVKELTTTEGSFVFEPDHDHRLAMAAAVMQAAGVKIDILHREVVNKSFPGFWAIAEGGK